MCLVYVFVKVLFIDSFKSVYMFSYLVVLLVVCFWLGKGA